jgi:HSP20 family molecular chaperone IbpA
MAKQQVVMAEHQLTSGDTIDRSFVVYLNGNYGHLFLTHQKLLFVEEKGFFKKTYDIVVDLPYIDITKINVEQRNTNLTITDTRGKVYDIAFDPASTIARFISELKG